MTAGTYAPYFGALVPLREQPSESVSALELDNIHNKIEVYMSFAIA